MSILQHGRLILEEITRCFEHLDSNVIEDLVCSIRKAHRVFFIGSGRSGLVLSAFCMRLNHLGIPSYIAGNIPCPPVKTGDLVIAASGSGKTASVMAILNKIRLEGVTVFIITASAKKNIFAKTDVIISIASPSELMHNSDSRSNQLMRTLFEQTVFLLAETVVLYLSQNISHKEIAKRHTNLE